MTDLPTIEVTLPPEEPKMQQRRLLLEYNEKGCYDTRHATLEDVRAVLDAAGYLVAKKADFKFDVRPFSFTQPAVVDDDEETSGTADGASGGAEEAGSVSRPAECREEPGTLDQIAVLLSEHRFGDEPLTVCVARVAEAKLVYDAKTRKFEAELAALKKRHEDLLRQIGEKVSEIPIDEFVKRVAQQVDGATVGAALLQQKLDEAKKIAKDAIDGLALGAPGLLEAVRTLRERLGKL